MNNSVLRNEIKYKNNNENNSTYKGIRHVNLR